MKVVVIGAGVVGMCCAFELHRAGAEVCILERGEVGQGVSRGNTGWVCPSFTYPLPAPGIIGEGLKALAHGGGPLVIHPSLDPTFVRWLWRFRQNCSRSRWEQGVKALLALNARTLELFDEYVEAGVEFEMHRTGLLLVARTAEGLSSYKAVFRELKEIGFDGETTELGAAESAELEPALDRSALVGGVHARVDRYVRPETLTAGLAAHLSARGVEIRQGTAVTGIAGASTGLVVQTASGPIAAERVVAAAGPSSPPLLTALGIRMPMVGARGYSVTIAAGETRPRHALYLAEAKVGVSSYRDAVRIAGVFELGRENASVDPQRVARMVATVEPYFERWRPGSEPAELEWAGLRPMTADGLPLIGPAPAHPGVFVATGHGMLGVTLAPATAAALAPLVLEGRQLPELAPFLPARAA